jgi:hypothetical protein
MSQEHFSQGDTPVTRGPQAWLEWITAGVLWLVVIALGWITVAPQVPEWGLLATEELEVIAFLGLLTAALILVSVLALLHTRVKRP